jgi:catechol 2,3-dioxygenase-like lactoylglutathione lyase family enzyme
MGLREVHRGDLRPDGLGVWVLLEDPRSHQRIELNWYPRSSRFAKPFVNGESLDHIGFLLGPVPRARLEAEYARLLRQGARPTPITPTVSDGWVANVKDPDGNWVEIFRAPTAEERRQAKAEAAAPRRKRQRA